MFYFEDPIAQRKAEREYCFELEWEGVLRAAGRGAESANPAVTIEYDRLHIDHERQVVTFDLLTAVWSLEPRELAKALRLMAATIESEVQR